MINQVKTENGIVRILDDSVLEAYNESIEFYSAKARETLGKFDSEDSELTGSNPFMLVHLANSGALPKNTRLATIDDLVYAGKKDWSFLKGNYTDFGLALKTGGDGYQEDDLIAKRLASQLKQRDIRLGKGKLIQLDALSLVENQNSENGLVFDLKDNVESSVRDLTYFELCDYIEWKSLERAYFDRSWGWYSFDRSLAGSGGIGRVVVCGEATPQNFQQDDLMQKVRSP